MVQKLALSSLSDLPASLSVPAYDRGSLSAGILHIGVGNFHRAHQASYLDALFELGQDHDWAIIGAGIMPFDTERRAELKAQNWLSTVVEMSPGQVRARVTGAMIDFCPTDSKAMIERIADPSIRIISLTITEGGYFIDAATDCFEKTHPDICHDAQIPDAPRTVFGIILAGLSLRWSKGFAPPAILSCDNIPENGRVAQQALEGLAGLISGDLKNWVSGNVAFPNAMVDRITPATSDGKREFVSDNFGVDDAAPVVCEPFKQWVMEDNFPLGRPELELVGVQFVSDITAYETMKLRILNAGHAAIAYPAALLGYECVHDAINDPVINRWLTHLMCAEVIPVLEPIPGVDYNAYLATCVDRFANPEVRDTVARLCQDGSNRQPKFILPTIVDALEQNRPVDGLALELALWCRYCSEQADLSDVRASVLSQAARESQQNPHAFLLITEVFGNLVENERFATCFARYVVALWNNDPRSVLSEYLELEAA